MNTPRNPPPRQPLGQGGGGDGDPGGDGSGNGGGDGDDEDNAEDEEEDDSTDTEQVYVTDVLPPVPPASVTSPTSNIAELTSSSRGQRGKKKIVNNINMDTSGLEQILTSFTGTVRDILDRQRTTSATLARHAQEQNETQLNTLTALEVIANETASRDYCRMFDTLKSYDGIDPYEFEAWIEDIETACEASGKDKRKMVYSFSRGPVADLVQSLPISITYADFKRELRRNFSIIKTRMHAASAYQNFAPQESGENL